MKKLNYVKKGDYKDLIKDLIEQDIKVDLCLTDPPYNISRKNNFKTMNRSGIDFGEWDKNFDQLSWIEDVDKVLKKQGSIIIFNNWKNMGDIANKLTSLGYEIKDFIRWTKSNPMPRNINSRYVIDYEYGVWATKSQKWTFNKSKDESYLRPDFKFPVVSSKERIHPTQKPLGLFEKLIAIHSNKGDLILDPFMGSGTTAIASMNMQRNFIGSEIDEEYYLKLSNRIENNKNLFNMLEQANSKDFDDYIDQEEKPDNYKNLIEEYIDKELNKSIKDKKPER